MTLRISSINPNPDPNPNPTRLLDVEDLEHDEVASLGQLAQGEQAGGTFRQLEEERDLQIMGAGLGLRLEVRVRVRG